MSVPQWTIFIPSTYRPRAGDVADLLVHFHGDPQTYWNNVEYAHLSVIVVSVNYGGLSSRYSTPFADPARFGGLMDEALATVRAVDDIPDDLQWDKIAVSSFSAGFGAVREILKIDRYRDAIDSLLAADSLYATTAADGTPLDEELADYKAFATAAVNGQKTFVYSHSQVVTNTGPDGYESTYECADELMQYVGISPTPTTETGLGSLTFYRRAQAGRFSVWGAT